MPVRRIKLVGNPRRRGKRNAKGQFIRRRIKSRKNRRPRAKAHTRRRVTRRAAHKNARSVVRRRRRSNNPGLVLMGLNPIRGGSHMKRRRKTRKLKKNRRRYFGGRYGLKHNPHVRHYRRHRQNPFGFTWAQFFGLAGAAIAGGVGTRAIPQLVAPTYNQGVVGYLLNLIAAGGGAYLVAFFNKTWALGWAVGGTVMVAGRVVQDYFGKQLVTFALLQPGSSVAQPAAAVAAPAKTMSGLNQGDLAFDLRGALGKYASTYFPLPSGTPAGSKGQDALVRGKPWAGDIATAIAQKGKQHSATSLKGGRYGGIM